MSAVASISSVYLESTTTDRRAQVVSLYHTLDLMLKMIEARRKVSFTACNADDAVH